MLIDKNKLIAKEWQNVTKYLQKDTGDSIKLAIIEAENVFIKIVNSKNYKIRDLDKKIEMAVKEVKRPEVFLQNRERALKIKNEVGGDIFDAYSGQEIVEVYKEAIEDILFGIIDEKKLSSLKYRFWRVYYWIFSRKKSILRILFIALAIIALMLFIADSDLGKNTFNLIIDQIHFILRVILFAIFLAFLVVFFITFSVIIWDSRFKKRLKR